MGRKSIAGAAAVWLVLVGGADAAGAGGGAARIKDLAALAGAEAEPLLGYGLVVGLSGSGDGQTAAFTVNSLTAMLERLGVTVDPAQVKLKNVAAVLVTAQLDPSAAAGTRCDVTVSSLGDASSLEGGTLIMTPLKSAAGDVHALAQGSVSIGGFNVRGGANNSIRKNHSTVGLIPGGGRVTTPLPRSFLAPDGKLSWLLHHPDFNTAAAVAQAINGAWGAGTAVPVDARRIEVAPPSAFAAQPVAFIAMMGELEAASDVAARVVINERTGTIVVGHGVALREAAVAHGNLKVVIRTRYDVSQPNSFNESGHTVVTPEVIADVHDQQASVLQIPDTGSVADVVDVLNEIGASPRDIIAILQALKQAGALQADLQIM